MLHNSEYITRKCACDKPNWKVIRTEYVKSGINIGRKKYFVYCVNCGKQWKTFSTKGIRKEQKNERL